jgi:hypothetical protein
VLTAEGRKFLNLRTPEVPFFGIPQYAGSVMEKSATQGFFKIVRAQVHRNEKRVPFCTKEYTLATLPHHQPTQRTHEHDTKNRKYGAFVLVGQFDFESMINLST